VDLLELNHQLHLLKGLLFELNAPRSIISNIDDVGKTIRWLETYVNKR